MHNTSMYNISILIFFVKDILFPYGCNTGIYWRSDELYE